MAVTLFYFSICIDLQYFVCEWNALLVNRFIAPINLFNLSKGNAKNQNALNQNEEIETVPCAFFIADSQSSIHYSQHLHRILHEAMKSFHLTRTHTQANMVSLVVLILWPDFFLHCITVATKRCALQMRITNREHTNIKLVCSRAISTLVFFAHYNWYWSGVESRENYHSKNWSTCGLKP